MHIKQPFLVENDMSEIVKGGQDKIARWEFYLKTMLREIPTFQSLRKNYQILDARWEGVFEIPPQDAFTIYAGNPNTVEKDEKGYDPKREQQQFDNEKINRLNPQTWINAMMGGINTSDLPIKRKTITITDSASYTGHLPKPSIVGSLLQITVTQSGVEAMPGDIFTLGNPKRTYELSYKDVDNNHIWYCAPGILPLPLVPALNPARDNQAAINNALRQIGLPQPTRSIKFRLRGQPTIVESQDRHRYGGWTVPWEEAIEAN